MDFFNPSESELVSPLYDWVFHFNSFSNTWAAIPRDLYQVYWSDANHPLILRSRDINTLIDLLYKTNGDLNKIEQLTKPQ